MLNVKNTDLIDDLQTDKEVISRRNERLHKFFEMIFGEKFVIIGDMNKPSVIHLPEKGPSKCISCFVHNFTLTFTSEPFNGEHIHSVQLTMDNIRIVDVEQIMKVIDSAQHKTVFRIKVKETNLFLSGYNFKDKGDYDTKYPVFAPHGEKVYFNVDHAMDIIEKYPEYGLEVTAY
jgi:hypothetical protein